MILPIIGGLVFGFVIFELNSRLLMVTLNRAEGKAPGQAVKYVVSRYYLRFLIEGAIICFVVWESGTYFGMGTLGGLLIAKAVFLLRVRNINKD